MDILGRMLARAFSIAMENAYKGVSSKVHAKRMARFIIDHINALYGIDFSSSEFFMKDLIGYCADWPVGREHFENVLRALEGRRSIGNLDPEETRMYERLVELVDKEVEIRTRPPLNRASG